MKFKQCLIIITVLLKGHRMNTHKPPTKLIPLALLLAVILGCGDSDDASDLIGSWSLQTYDGQDWKVFARLLGVVIEDKWTFHDNGTWDLQMTFEVLGSKETEQTEGTYSITDTTFSMSSPDPEFRLSDLFDISIEVGEPEGDADNSAEPQSTENTGTWVRDGNTLTLTLADGKVLVFKKL